METQILSRSLPGDWLAITFRVYSRLFSFNFHWHDAISDAAAEAVLYLAVTSPQPL